MVSSAVVEDSARNPSSGFDAALISACTVGSTLNRLYSIMPAVEYEPLSWMLKPVDAGP